MSTRNDRFNQGIRSLERALTNIQDTSKAVLLSDRGAGVERMLDDLDNKCRPSKFQVDRERETAVDIAKAILILFDLEHLARTLALIFENGSHFRDRSIRSLCRDNRKKACFKAAKRRYERNRKALLKLFMSLSVHGDIEGRDVGEVPTR